MEQLREELLRFKKAQEKEALKTGTSSQPLLNPTPAPEKSASPPPSDSSHSSHSYHSSDDSRASSPARDRSESPRLSNASAPSPIDNDKARLIETERPVDKSRPNARATFLGRVLRHTLGYNRLVAEAEARGEDVSRGLPTTVGTNGNEDGDKPVVESEKNEDKEVVVSDNGDVAQEDDVETESRVKRDPAIDTVPESSLQQTKAVTASDDQKGTPARKGRGRMAFLGEGARMDDRDSQRIGGMTIDDIIPDDNNGDDNDASYSYSQSNSSRSASSSYSKSGRRHRRRRGRSHSRSKRRHSSKRSKSRKRSGSSRKRSRSSKKRSSSSKKRSRSSKKRSKSSSRKSRSSKKRSRSSKKSRRHKSPSCSSYSCSYSSSSASPSYSCSSKSSYSCSSESSGRKGRKKKRSRHRSSSRRKSHKNSSKKRKKKH